MQTVHGPHFEQQNDLFYDTSQYFYHGTPVTSGLLTQAVTKITVDLPFGHLGKVLFQLPPQLQHFGTKEISRNVEKPLSP